MTLPKETARIGIGAVTQHSQLNHNAIVSNFKGVVFVTMPELVLEVRDKKFPDNMQPLDIVVADSETIAKYAGFEVAIIYNGTDSVGSAALDLGERLIQNGADKVFFWSTEGTVNILYDRRNFQESSIDSALQNVLIASRRFQLTPFNQITHSTQNNYLIKDLIPRQGLVVVYGPPKCGKTFMALDWMMHVALGWCYQGHKVKPGAVVYITCEGHDNFNKRAVAFKEKYPSINNSDVPFQLLSTQLDLVQDYSELISDIQFALQGKDVAAIVIDTLNRSFSGSESSDKDMAEYIKALDRLQNVFQCALVVIHHCGHNESRPRGHSALIGALDTQIAITGKDGIVTAKVELMKDGEAGLEIHCQLESVEIGQDDDDNSITSCVLVASDAPPSKLKRGLKGANKIAFEQIQNAIIDGGKVPPPCSNIPPHVKAVKKDIWRDRCYKGSISESDKLEAKQKAFKRAADTLQAENLIGVWDDWVWIV